MVRVLLDATAIPADRGGVGRYLDGLVPALAARRDVSVVLACQRRDLGQFGGLDVQLEPVAESLEQRPRRLGWEQFGLPRLTVKVGVDVLHCPHYTMPLRSAVPVTVTLHDATFFSDPALHTAGKARFFRAATRVALRRAEALVVPSAATASELSRLISTRADRAVIAQHGVDTTVFRPPSDDQVAQLRAHLDLGDQRFVAFVGTIEPRKNVPALIAAWQRVAAIMPDPPALVLAGGRGWDDRVAEVLAQVPAGLRVIRPGYLALELLPALFGAAEVVAYPALGEGFGLPVLEAMACGAATMTTRRLALPEVGGDAVEYCPVDAQGMARVLAELLGDPGRRAELARLGIERAATFSWAASAAAHVRAYVGAVDGRGASRRAA